MKYNQAEIRQAAQQADISDTQQEAMLSILQENKQASGGLGSTLLLWFGGLLVLSALRWPLERVFKNDVDWAQAILSGVVFLCLLVLGLCVYYTQKRTSLKNSVDNSSRITSPKSALESWSSAIILFFALSSISVLVASIQICLGWKVDKDVFFLLSDDVFLPAFVTLVSSSIVLYVIPHRLFAFVVYMSFWLASMSLLHCLDDHGLFLCFDEKQSACVVGIVILLATLFVDHRFKIDYAAIGYIVGALSLWCGIAVMDSISELDRFLFFIFNLFFIAISFILGRSVFIVLGFMGACVYFEHIADKYMDELYYQFALCLIGLVILLLGLHVHQYRKAIMTYIQKILPRWIVAIRPAHRQ